MASFTSIFSGKKGTSSSSSSAPKKKKKVKKLGEKKLKTKMPLEDQIMDETQDMVIK